MNNLFFRTSGEIFSLIHFHLTVNFTSIWGENIVMCFFWFTGAELCWTVSTQFLISQTMKQRWKNEHDPCKYFAGYLTLLRSLIPFSLRHIMSLNMKNKKVTLTLTLTRGPHLRTGCTNRIIEWLL